MQHFIKYISLFYLIITLCVNAQEGKQTDIEWPSLANSTWPMTHGNPQSNGRANVVGPQEGNVIWEVSSLYGAFSGPVINSEGALHYLAAGYNVGLFTYKDSTEFWNLKVNYKAQSGMIVDSSGTIYFGNNNDSLYAVTPDGKYKWRYFTGSNIYADIINIDQQGNIYFTNEEGYLYSLDKSGNLRWKIFFDDGFKGSIAISPDGNNIYCPGKDSLFYSINIDGTEKWKYNIGSYDKIDIHPLVDSQGNVYLSLHNKIISLSPEKELRWEYQHGKEIKTAYGAPSMDYEGNLYINVYSLGIISLDYNGNHRWTFTPEGTEIIEGITQPLICDKEGSIYFGSTWGYYYYSVSKDGELKWKIPLYGAEVDNTGAFDKNGTLYVCVHSDGNRAMLAIADSTSTGINDKNNVINDFELHQNFPNPFNPSTKINFTISERGNYSLKVFNSLGEVVSEILNGELNAGNHEIIFDGTELSSGIYYYQLSGKNVKVTRKMVLIK